MNLTHVAIIPDGNRRWAKGRGLPFYAGHQKSGDEILPSLIERAGDLGIKYFTFWALSTENLKNRRPEEVQYIFKLGTMFFRSKIDEMSKKGARIRAIGDLNGLPSDIRSSVEQAEIKTQHNTKIIVQFAINYGGRDEIIRAVQKAQAKNISVTKENFGSYLDTHGIPDPDLIIRTGGDKRLSGFMLWQNEYSELMFLDQYFPDFTPDIFEQCIQEYTERQRRFGK